MIELKYVIINIEVIQFQKICKRKILNNKLKNRRNGVIC